MELEEGIEYQIGNKEQWESMITMKGEILEVHLPSTNHGGGHLGRLLGMRRVSPGR